MTLSSGAPRSQPSLAGQAIQDLAVHIAGSLVGGVARASPSEWLRDLQLGPVLQKAIGVLQGFRLEPCPLSKPLYGLKCTLSVLKGPDVTYYLMQAPIAILNDPSMDNWGAFNALAYLFERRARLFIFCESLDAPALAYRQIIEKIWRNDRDIMANYIPWRDIIDLLRQEPGDQADFLGQLLGLDASAPAGPLALTGGQRQQLQKALLSAYPDRGALEQMVRFRLNENLASIAGDPDLGQAAFGLIEWAESQGKLEDLIRGARGQNPGNPELAAFAKQILAS